MNSVKPSSQADAAPVSSAPEEAGSELARARPANGVDEGLSPPLGMRDLLPPESRARRDVSTQIQAVFERYGYELITTPLFERVQVFERGLLIDRRDLLRFVEPDSGEVTALRPDITPQIARVVSTRLAGYPPPWRIRYEGTVIRRRRRRARKQRQIAQLGVELIGLAEADADAEVIQLCAEACGAVGLSDFRIELADVGVARSLLAQHSAELVDQVQDAFGRKDEALLMQQLAGAGVARTQREQLASLLHMHGPLEVLREAEALLRDTPAQPHIESLLRVAALLREAGLGPRLGVDLGEIRGQAYYTGVSFALFAKGPGEAVASGGRYDDLLGRYGRAHPATGAAIDVENLLWALDTAQHPWRNGGPARVIVAGDADRARALASALRAQGLAAATLPGADRDTAARYAEAWSVPAFVVLTRAGAIAQRVGDGRQTSLGEAISASEIQLLVAWLRAE